MNPRALRVTALALSVVAMTMMAGSAMGGFSGTINAVMGNDSAATAVLSTTVAGGTGPCSSTGAGTSTAVNNVNCPDSVLPSGPASASPAVTSKTLTLNNLSTPNTLAPQLALQSCSVQSVTDSRPDADTGIIHNTVTYGTAGALTGGTAMTFSQASSAYVATTKTYTNPSTFSIVAWFNFPANASTGTILGFSDSHTNAGQSTSDRSLWLSGRRVYWGVLNNGAKQVIGSTTNLANSTWHLVVATVTPTTQTLYVDNQAVVSSAMTSTSNYTGYWHLGWGDEATGWGANAPTNAYWPGALDNAAVIPSQLSAAQVSNLYSQTTDAAETTVINSLTPTNFWALNDTASTLYSGTVPGAGTPSWLADTTGGGNALVNPGSSVTWTSSGGPLSGAAYATFSGANYLTSTTSYVNPQGYSVTAYFKTAGLPAGSGPVFEFTSSQLQSPVQWDRHVWIDATGHLVYGVYPGAVKEVTSPGATSYADNAWHQITATNGAAGLKMYVDGTLVATDATVTTSEVTTGWWHLGWGNMRNGWTNPPTNAYWTGGISEVAVFPSQLTNAQVTSLSPSVATTQAAFNAAVSALTPTVYWPMQSAAPTATTTCAGINASVQLVNGATTYCAYPVAAGACTSPPTTPLSGLSTAVALTAGASQTVTFTVTKSNVPASLTGTHAFASIRFSVTSGSFSAILNHVLSGSIDL